MSQYPAGNSQDNYGQQNNNQYYDQYQQQGQGQGQGQGQDQYYQNQYGDQNYYQQGQADDPQGGQYYPQDAYNQGYDAQGQPQPGNRGNEDESFSDFTMRTGQGESDYYAQNDGYGQSEYSPDMNDPRNAYGGQTPSSFAGNRSSGASTPLDGMDYSGFEQRSREPYPAWTVDNQVPITKEEIEDVFIDLANKFGFQRDSMRNVYDYFMVLLDSRASRMTPSQALLSVHADYIGGDNANYRKWYFAAQLDMDEQVGFSNMNIGKLGRKARKAKKKSKKAKQAIENNQDDPDRALADLEGDNSLDAAVYRWKSKMNKLSPKERVRQVALWLCLWGEANQVRFVPECLAFIYKCADDYFLSDECQNKQEPMPEGDYLNRIITPLYRFIRAQVYEIVEGKFVKREGDHNKVIGYDDVNQLFWYPEGIGRIVFNDGTRLVDIPPGERFIRLGDVEWKLVFFKTYKEYRTWFHLLTNFNRIWIMHICMYWFYTAFNAPSLYTKNYIQLTNTQPTPSSRWASCAFAGTIACLIQIGATICEWCFVPRKWAGAQHLSTRLMLLLLFLIINLGPVVFVFAWAPLNVYSRIAHIVSVIAFFIAVFTVLFFSVMPLGGLFTSYLNGKTRKYVSSQTFTASFWSLSGTDMWVSYLLWLVVLGAKFSESYFFLTLSLRDPIRDLATTKMTRCVGEVWFGTKLCYHQSTIVLGLMIVIDLILFFLDTYMWYIIVQCVFSVAQSFYMGISILTPWRNIFTRLPKRIYSKVLATTNMEIKYKPKVLISQVWNAIVISMYREHLLAIDHVQKLLYHQVPSEVEGKRTLRAPTFFVSQDDNNFETEFFPKNSEAERRLSFFAQSLATPLPEPLPVDLMPTFTVFVPHYGEKILLSLREIIREDDQFSRVTVLEYLKQLYPVEWDCFVKDTKILAEETAAFNEGSEDEKEDDTLKNKIDDLPFYCIGFKSAAPEYTLRTRIWASLRSQTLYRTISGFMNYSRAIKLLYRVENPEIVQMFGGNTEQLEQELERMARRKFKFCISMQRLTKFKPDEKENCEFLMRAYPDLQLAFLDEEPPENEGEEPRVFSAVIDGHCELLEDGRRRPKYRVQLSGNPILGDGKSDNQNHAIIFTRGEYLQLVDANQDNYLEECLKIRSVLAEFEEMNGEYVNPYTPGVETEAGHPVAILGAREYIFSENIGVLGDIAAGKEQTFGTLFARILAQIGGKLHYGHPDFLNATFMITRGGVSKAQKGLHLNEDIYAGMNAMMRGGRIKHCEFYQCGKGRDMGFGSILNFTTKIGAGMGEQMLAREYYYLGTQLPIDRFLSFYYAHPGFHVNNLFIMFSVQLFGVVLVNITALAHESILCSYDKNTPVTDPQIPYGCYNFVPVVDWIRRYVLSIFIVFFISFIPLFVQELTEKGVWKAASRLLHHFASVSPIFEVFVCQIYANALTTDMTFGGARYIATGRGMATTRIPFSVLYSRFASTSIYSGAICVMCLLFGCVGHWQPALLWFWLSNGALCIAPFCFNPHQFALTDFFIDYRDFIRWLSRGNTKFHQNSWIGFVRMGRARVTGFKKKVVGDASEKGQAGRRAHRTNVMLADFMGYIIPAAGCFVAFTFINAQNGVSTKTEMNSTLRLVICALGPIVIDMGIVGILGGIACCMGPLLGVCCKKTAAVTAGIAHGIGVFIHLIFFVVMWFFEGFSFTKLLVGMCAVVTLQQFFLAMIELIFLTREFKNDHANRAWWSGKWYNTGMGWRAMTQPFREFVCKFAENSYFAGDFTLGHILLFCHLPLLCVPYMDKWHSAGLFWLKPSRQIRPPIFSMKQNKLRKRMVRKYATLYFIVLIFFLILLIAPAVAGKMIDTDSLSDKLPSFADGLIQPANQDNNDTGPENCPSTFLTTTPSTSSYATKP